jgi:NAD(P)-dependent dehydrogenase (short-subunit alcohol dehydrogenase family)
MPLDTLNPATLMSGRFKQEQIPDLTGRVAVVTGGSAGIGYHDALGLARAGAKVLILSATPEHGETAEAEMNAFLKENYPNGKGHVKWYQIDLGDLKAVDKLAKSIAQEEERLDILINNAGGLNCFASAANIYLKLSTMLGIGQAPYGLTKDGLENHYAVCSCFGWSSDVIR